ncbi:hypothetical protein HX004_06165 [Myroides sp. 1354]|uniref:hypothetical protein n=1 Tax=unclassified Myroides TaxID=2642485 RepID=UPI0025751F71|nr:MULTISPECIES: hypothetical protein [unclassified Myroides]MDM1044645.1 hypothetical protein [Myroides sp. R163-1]MDM1055358.1 hypothetical protein [Myroides sp. 1354]MDM1068655.1 hypothetical protein [Myroides sp. 1372]
MRQVFPSQTLHLPQLNSCKKYGIQQRMDPSSLDMKYIMQVNRNQDKIELRQEQVFVGNKEINQPLDELVQKVNRGLYPIVVTYKPHGGLNQIANSAEIKQRWRRLIFPMLKQYYQGATSDAVLEHINVSVEQLNLRQDDFKRNLFYRFFFLPIYQTFSSEQETKFLLSIYFSSMKRFVTYQTTCTVSSNYTLDHKIELIIEGKVRGKLGDALQQEGEIRIQYKLHQDTHEIFSIIAKMTSFEQEIASKIEFELFELKARQ